MAIPGTESGDDCLVLTSALYYSKVSVQTCNNSTIKEIGLLIMYRFTGKLQQIKRFAKIDALGSF